MAPESSFGTAPALERRASYRTLPPLDSSSLRRCRRPRQTGGKLARQSEAARLVAARRSHPRRPGPRPSRRPLLRTCACSFTWEKIWRAGSSSAWNSPSATRTALPRGICYQSFAGLLIQDAPPDVQAKLRKWGVADYKSIFSRALGLHTLFAAAPPREILSDEFVRSYFRFADQIFQSKQSECDFVPAHLARIPFRALFLRRILPHARTFLG